MGSIGFYIGTGALMYFLSVIAVGIGAAGGSSVVLFVGGIVGLIATFLVLVGIIGWGVSLGIRDAKGEL